MSSQVLARKWRPRDFAGLVGQEHVVRALRHALEQGRLHHAYLFTGTRGVGKTTLARILAKCLNCESAAAPTATPCGRCGACIEIDAGRFVDLLEVDAATNTKVDEMRQLLETVQYAPARGRYKVYVIDEVHQLSGHAFNAMLKTLEEPPAHLKFVLATTDPQKIPVTVLSRCLQFNLKQMPRQAIVEHLARLLEAEGVRFESQALPPIGRAAAGSMRDALSLLDQAIAYGGGVVEADAVREMLGAVDRSYLFRLLESLADGDAAGMLAVADEMQSRSLAFDAALAELAALLLQMAIVQTAPDAADATDPEAGRVSALAGRLDPETVQLCYQIAVQGRADLPLAPDEMAGFTMTLLRMRAFLPAGIEPVSRTPAAAVQPAPAAASGTVQSVAPPRFNGDWPGFAAMLPLSGLVRRLALESELADHAEGRFELVLPAGSAHLASDALRDRLQAAVAMTLGRAVRIRVSVGEVHGYSAAVLDARARDASVAAAEDALRKDAFVRDLETTFGATLDRSSIRPPQ